MKTLTTWRRNFRRRSTQLAAALSAVAAFEGLPQVVQAMESSLPMWQPILPPWAFALLTMVTGMLIAYVRNLPQQGVD